MLPQGQVTFGSLASSNKTDTKFINLKSSSSFEIKCHNFDNEVNGILSKDNIVLTKRNSDKTGTSKKDLNESLTSVEQPLIWLNIIAIGLFHFVALYAYLTFPYLQRPLTFLWGEYV